MLSLTKLVLFYYYTLFNNIGALLSINQFRQGPGAALNTSWIFKNILEVVVNLNLQGSFFLNVLKNHF